MCTLFHVLGTHCALFSFSFPRRLHPPHTLVVGMELSTSSITMLQDPPQWSLQATAPTDWTLLQQAKALRMGGTPPPVQNHHVAHSHKSYPLATTALGMQPSAKANNGGWRFVLTVMVVVVAVCFGGMQGQSTVGPTPVKTLASSSSLVQQKLPPPRTMRRKKKPTTVKTAVKRVHMDRKVMTMEKHNRRHVVVHNNATTVVQQAMDNNVWTLQPWVEFMTSTPTTTATTPHVELPKRQLAKRVEWLIVESHKLRWAGQRFLI